MSAPQNISSGQSQFLIIKGILGFHLYSKVMENLSIQARLLLATPFVVLAFTNFQHLMGTSTEVLEERLADVAQVFDQAPASITQTNHGTLSLKAERTTLTISLDKMPSGTDFYDQQMVRIIAYALVCDGKVLQDLLEDGATLRFEATMNNGKKFKPFELEECP